MTTALATRKLTKTQLLQLSTYTDPGTILAALKKKGWTINKAIEKLVDIIDDTDTKVSTQLAAIKYLNQMVIDAMERSGMMVIATRTIRGEDGEEVTFTGHIASSNLQGPTDHTTMEELTGDDFPIEKEIKDDKTEKKTRKRKPKKTSKREPAKGDGKPGNRTKRDGRPGNKGNTTRGAGSSRDSGGGEKGTTGHTETGLSDDLHSSKHPEVHLDSFKGLAVPAESRVPGPADSIPASTDDNAATESQDYL